MDRNHCPQSIGIPVRNRRNPHTLFRTIHDLSEHIGSFGEFEITLGGVRCLGEYQVVEPGRLVHVELAFIAAGAEPHGHLFIDDDGSLGIELEIKDEDVTHMEFDDHTITGTA